VKSGKILGLVDATKRAYHKIVSRVDNTSGKGTASTRNHMVGSIAFVRGMKSAGALPFRKG
jgi:hypothetical protein